MELIEITGYILEEKVELPSSTWCRPTERPRNDQRYGLIPWDTIIVIDKYTRESGVRELDKQINQIGAAPHCQEDCDERGLQQGGEHRRPY